MSKILIITDAWEQTNGVVTTYLNLIKQLEKRNYEVKVIGPKDFKSRSLPSYKEIKVAINPWTVSKLIEKEQANYIHIATEGPIGFFAARYCNKKGYHYTTSYHTKFPEYVNQRIKFIKPSFVYRFLKRVHKNAQKTFVTTDSMKKELISNGFDSNKLITWTKGIDREQFNEKGRKLSKKARALYVGRVSVEKNIEAFLDLPIVASKYVVGDGPHLAKLKEKYGGYPDIHFVGEKKGKELQWYYANSEIFVFPSKTDTFGMVMLEANACGTPVIGFPVTGPKDFVVNGVNGYVSDDLFEAYHTAILLDRRDVLQYSKIFSWERATDTFLEHITQL